MMLPISKRAEEIPDSPIRKLVPLAEQARARGKKVYALNIGQPDVPTALPFVSTLQSFNKTVVGYGRSEGEPELRQAIARYYESVGITLSAEQIVVTVGGSEAILFAMQCVAEPGEEILCFEPFYTNYNSLAMMSGVHIKPVRTQAHTGFHLPNEADIKAHITDKTRAILICSPNNPTGTVLTQDELRCIARLAHAHNLFVISDEVYREFVYDGQHVSILTQKELKDRAILVDSISKRYSACGARIGFLATYHEPVRKAAVRMSQARLCPPIAEQLAAQPLMDLPAHFFEPIKQEYLARRDALYAGLMQIPGVTCLLPKGAFYMMAEMPIPDCEHFAQWLLTTFDYEQETLMVAPGPGFYARGKYEQKNQGLNQIRLAYVLEVPQIKRAMDILKIAVAEYQTEFLS